MKKLILILAATCMLFSLQSCYRAMPGGGQEIVLVTQPVIFGHGGVVDEPVTTGATWCVFSTKEFTFNIKPQSYTEEFTNMIPSDNTPVSFSAFLKLQVKKGYSPYLYDKFGEDWYNQNIKEVFRTCVRENASTHTMFELASKREVSAALQTKIFDQMTKYIKGLNMPVDVLLVTIGAITPPAEVLTETKNTAAQNQSKLTQTARADAESFRKQAEINKAIADKAYMNQMGMTIAEYTHIRQLEITKEQVELLKDHKNVTITFIQGANIPTTHPVK